jgi:electron transfer flavoprotein alpha subunit
MGIRDARHVAAVNLDAGAPMLERAEWGAVADVDLVIPALLRCLAPDRE